MRVLGLDYGARTIGVAVSDESRKIAFGLEVIRRSDEAAIKKSIARLRELIAEYFIDTIVLGYPLNLSGDVSERCEAVTAFKARLLRNFKRVTVILWDERLTTAASHKAFNESGWNPAKKNAVIDKIAATLILQGYLDSITNQN